MDKQIKTPVDTGNLITLESGELIDLTGFMDFCDSFVVRNVGDDLGNYAYVFEEFKKGVNEIEEIFWENYISEGDAEDMRYAFDFFRLFKKFINGVRFYIEKE